jgi:dTDP-4-dehydrorhamnose reductase
MGATWLVTGGAGFLGMNAGAWLGDRARRVSQTRMPRPLGPFDEQISIDLRNAKAIAKIVRTLRPDVILNAAAISGHETCANDPAQAFAVNVEAARILSLTAAEIGARMVHISTDAVFSGSDGNYREGDAVDPFSVYGETKLAGEAEVLGSGADALVLRTNFFGWSSSGHRSVLEFFVNSLRADTAVKGYPDFIVTSLYVRTLMELIWQLNEVNATGLLHVASADAMSKYDFGAETARVFNLDAGLIAPTSASAAGHATSRSRNLSLNTEALRSALGSTPQTQREGIEQARREESTVAVNLRSFEDLA